MRSTVRGRSRLAGLRAARRLLAVDPTLPVDEPEDLLLATAVRRADVPLGWVRRIVAPRPVEADKSGSYARRVKHAADRRRALAAFDDARRSIIDGGDLSEAIKLIDGVRAA